MTSRFAGGIVRVLILACVPSVVAASAQAQSLQIVGYAGVLGEWELTATVTADASRLLGEFSGPLTMRHTGLCTQDGPEEKIGEMRLQRSAALSRLNATLSVAGVACSYSGKLAEFYTGTLDCPDRPAVPLKLWVR
jgi:hypothetical protein